MNNGRGPLLHRYLMDWLERPETPLDVKNSISQLVANATRERERHNLTQEQYQRGWLLTFDARLRELAQSRYTFPTGTSIWGVPWHEAPINANRRRWRQALYKVYTWGHGRGIGNERLVERREFFGDWFRMSVAALNANEALYNRLDGR